MKENTGRYKSFRRDHHFLASLTLFDVYESSKFRPGFLAPHRWGPVLADKMNGIRAIRVVDIEKIVREL